MRYLESLQRRSTATSFSYHLKTLIAYSANDFIVCKSFAVNEFITLAAYAKLITAKECDRTSAIRFQN
ncbi:hypothetical protein [Nostoc sp. CHAB 5715]|uniref:hypothetical protein n=1 Tax=Nostoc sp. CHAB 5715 TaxID=2780400 RepID=UPI001E387002|nr:hypothetical protein [Nostoc sp. CHAB 5715]MCC5626475.1 hypothetical protein [Nostoc sp. CHAB 5715]